VNSITIKINRNTRGIDQAPSGEEWNYMITIDGRTATWEGAFPFYSLEAALSSITKYLKQRQIEEKQNQRGPN
jgi:hypothetical protein